MVEGWCLGLEARDTTAWACVIRGYAPPRDPLPPRLGRLVCPVFIVWVRMQVACCVSPDLPVGSRWRNHQQSILVEVELTHGHVLRL